MDNEIRRIYLELSERAPGDVFLARDATNLDEVVRFVVRDIAEVTSAAVFAETKVKLREDAKLLIQLLFEEMIFKPILAAEKMSLDQAIQAMKSDLETVLRNARPDESNEISGHAILATVSQIWSQLRFNQMGIWF